MHFIQKTPGDSASLEDIAKALGISISVQAGERPQVRESMIRCHILGGLLKKELR